MPRTGENIYKRKDGRWEGRYVKGHKPAGKAIYGYVYAYSYKETKTKLNLAISGRSPSLRCKTSETTFSELSELWLGSQRARVKESTYSLCKHTIRIHHSKFIVRKPLDPCEYMSVCHCASAKNLLQQDHLWFQKVHLKKCLCIFIMATSMLRVYIGQFADCFTNIHPLLRNIVVQCIDFKQPFLRIEFLLHHFPQHLMIDIVIVIQLSLYLFLPISLLLGLPSYDVR